MEKVENMDKVENMENVEKVKNMEKVENMENLENMENPGCYLKRPWALDGQNHFLICNNSSAPHNDSKRGRRTSTTCDHFLR